MTDRDVEAAVVRARAAYEARQWNEAQAGFGAARAGGRLLLEDAERFAWCHVWTLAPVADGIGAFEDFEEQALEQGERVVAARAAIEQVRMHAMAENTVLVGACYRRAVDHAADDPSTLLLLEMYPALGASTAGDFQLARQISEDVLPRARAIGDGTLQGLAIWQIGAGLIVAGEMKEGIERLDESMALATDGSMHPLYAGMLTCGVVMTCRAIGDWRRAKEWTEVADRYCSRKAVCHYPGHCSVFRSELRRLEGDLAGATEEATASLLLNGDWSKSWIGAAHHQRGEAQLCRGNLGEAQAAFEQAIEVGYNPQPGQAQLHLLAGDSDAAFRSIRDAIDDASVMVEADRLSILVAGVGIAVDIGELDTARRWRESLGGLSRRYRTDGAAAAVEQAVGRIALAEDRPGMAVDELRKSVSHWAAAGSSIYSARARVVLATALDAQGDAPEAALERGIAAAAFERIGAATDLAAIAVTHTRSGPVRRTLSFTDIVGSSQLLAAMGDEAWVQVLTVHDNILRDTLNELGGAEVKHEGDGMFVAFEYEHRAVTWAIEVQRRLNDHRSGTGFLPEVRIGVHCGDAVPYGDDFIGKCVHETARIANAAGAGQIFVSEITMEAIDNPPAALARHELDLKGFEHPHNVVELDWSAGPQGPGRPQEMPAG